MIDKPEKSLDANGYAESILQLPEYQDRCYLCSRYASSANKLDRHEVFGASNRDKSKQDGLWVMLCHDTCHEGVNGVHLNAAAGRRLKRMAQRAAMKYYGWTEEDFRRRYGKSYLLFEDGDD